MFDSQSLVNDIVFQFIPNNGTLSKSDENIAKLHSGNHLAQQGDLSFPLLAKQWGYTAKPGASVLAQFQDDGGFQTAEECLKELVSRHQPFVARMQLHQNRVLVFLDRCRVFADIDYVIANSGDYGRMASGTMFEIEIHDEFEDINADEMLERNVTDYRSRLVRNVLRNIVDYCQSPVEVREVTRDSRPLTRWLVTHKSNGGGGSSNDNRDGERIIFCGVLRGAGQTGKKKTDITAGEYIR